MIRVDEKRCDVCGTCAGVCEVNAILIKRNRVYINHELCVLCRACISVCPVRAVKADD